MQQVLEQNRAEVAAIIVEPVAGNMGTVLPARGFLQRLRKLTREHGALLIFDEVITGFRLSYGGAQKVLNVKPDLTASERSSAAAFRSALMAAIRKS